MYLTKKEVVTFLAQAKANLRRKGTKTGFIFVKENTADLEEVDDEDGGVVRTDR